MVIYEYIKLSKIRVTYSGLISFGIRLLTIGTGLIFTLIVTRQLTSEEFGTWGLISGIIIYATIINPVISYWTTREISRGEKTARTGIYSSGILSVLGISIYLIIAFFVGIQSNADLQILFFAAMLIPVTFLHNIINAINLGHRPQVTSYGLIVFEISKILTALFFIYVLDFGVEGAILATVIAYISSSIILLFYAKEQLQSQFQRKYLLKWIKLSWLPIYRGIPSILHMSDVIIFSIITGSVAGVAYYTAARTIGMLVNHSRVISTGLYPKLLETEKQEFLQENLMKIFYFAFPLTAFSIIFAKPGLFALNPMYEIAAPVVIFISLRMFLKTLNQVFFKALQGIENIDKNQQIRFKDYIKSNLIWIPTFDLIRHGIYIGLLSILLLIFVTQTSSIIELVLYWTIIGFVIEIPLTIYIIHLTKKSFTLKIDKSSIIKYFLITIIAFGLTEIIIEENLEYHESIFQFLPSLIPYFIFSISIYFGMTYLIDHRTKKLVKGILNELIKKGDRK